MERPNNIKIKHPVKAYGKLFLIPSGLSSSDTGYFIPPANSGIIKLLNVFFVEDVRTARRFISSLKLDIAINRLQFYLLNKDTGVEALEEMISIVKAGNHAGILSEAGCPGVADPGAGLVNLAHRHNIRVIPLVGPSSILLSLMASGFNGQNFAFHGYLPVRETDRVKKIKELEIRMYKNNETQLFIETPYRNSQLFGSLIRTLKPETLLCIASDLTGAEESIKTMSVKLWQSQDFSMSKIPSIFLFYHE